MRVLVVDDEPTTALTIAAAVRQLGHETTVVHDGDRAWESFRTGEFDVVLTDRQMPGMDGVELCRRIREVDEGHFAYLVLITAVTGRGRALEGMEAGADDYLVKPVDPFDLRLRLLVAERVRAVHRELRATLAELAEANDGLAHLARTDRLTGIGNRRSFDEDLQSAAARAVRHDRPYAVMMVDVDRFKSYNDTFGHAAGDDVLSAIASVMATVLRKGDTVYRYGGEEFAVLLLEADLAGAQQSAQRLRAAVEELAIPAVEPAGGHVTVSAGVAAWTPGDPPALDLVRRADVALYAAKSRGRNTVVVGD